MGRWLIDTLGIAPLSLVYLPPLDRLPPESRDAMHHPDRQASFILLH